MKKYGLFKVLLILLLFVGLLTWIIPASYHDGSSLVDLGLYRVGFFDYFQFSFLTFQFSAFIQIAIYIIAVGALYGVLVATGKYRVMVEKLVKSLKGKEKLFLILTAFVIAGITSISGFTLLFFLFIPLLCSVILALGYDKLTAVMVTCMSVLIGIIGATFGSYSAGLINSVLSTTYTTAIYAKIALFVITFAVYILFTLKHADKAKKSAKKDENKKELDYLLGDTKPVKKSSWPIWTIFGILFVMMILGCLAWSDSFGISVFTNFNTTITSWTIGSHTILAYILGTISELGAWYYSEMAVLCIIASFIIGFTYKLHINDIFKAMIEGARKVASVAFLVLFAFTIVYLSANMPFINTIVGAMVDATKNYSVFMSTLMIAISSLLHVDLTYLVYVLPIMSGTFTSEVAISSMSLVTQSIYGVTMFIAPTSIMLIAGLTYLNIPYKTWVKHIWKFVLILYAIVLAILLIAYYV